MAEGTTIEGVPAPLSLKNPLFNYESRVTMEDTRMTIHRELHFKPGLIRQHAMGVLDDDIRRIVEFDTQSIVLKARGEER